MSRIEHCDCMAFLASIPDASADSCVTDPPYHLTAGKKGGSGPASVNLNTPQGRARITTGFMGKAWDGGDIAHRVEMWAEVLRALKPGAHLLAFAGTRTYHRMVCAIEDAGFEVRDQLGFMYGTGFPKSLNLDNFRGDKTCGCAVPYTHANAARPTPERGLHPVPNADVPTAVDVGDREGEVLQHGVPEQGVPPQGREQLPAAEVRRGKSSVEGRRDDLQEEGQLFKHSIPQGASAVTSNGAEGRLRNGAQADNGSVVRIPADEIGVRTSSGSQPSEQPAEQPGTLAGQPESQAGGAWPICGGCGKPILPAGLGTALKPAWEPIVVARKPLAGTVAANVLQHGCGALNVDACRIEASDKNPAPVGRFVGSTIGPTGLGGMRNASADSLGRWPANIIHDGSAEVLAAFPDSNGQQGNVTGKEPSSLTNAIYGKFNGRPATQARGDTGSAARFFKCCPFDEEDAEIARLFYSAKAGGDERDGNGHPTVKPLALMRYLVRLVTPHGGTVLDHFAGSGSTLIAAKQEGFSFLGCDLEAEHVAIINARLAKELL